MKKIWELLQLHWPKLLLCIIWLAIVVTNYQPGTWLSGWDNLHPEFDFWLSVKRSFSATWQEYQGVGLLGGMSHAADVTRQLFLWALSFVFPRDTLRYIWHFLMLLIGPLGVLSLATFLLSPKSSREKLSLKAASFMAGSFYLLNLATVQYFFTPFETFSSFYGFLPWLLYGALRYLKSHSSKDLLLFFAISVAASSAFYVQTLFVVYSFVLGIFMLNATWPFRASQLKASLKLALTILASNAFWLLPSLYSTLTASATTLQAKQNVISTPEVQYMNQYFGTLPDIALLKGYWFNYLDFDTSQKEPVFLFQAWRDHLAQSPTQWVGFGFFIMAVLGIIFLIKKKNFAFAPSIAFVFALVVLILTAGNGIFGVGFTFLSDHVPLFGQIFRTVFTKWSIVAALIYSLGLFNFFHTLLSFRMHRFAAYLRLLIVPLFISLLIFYTLPIFKGHFLADLVRVKIPTPYFELFSFFKTQPKQARIASFPVQSGWGWGLHTWKYSGSGFLWYGIEQPILDRAFDVWSPHNETYFNQISEAVYGNDPQALANTLKQYQVSYVLIDESITTYDRDQAFLLFPETKNLLSQIGAKVVWQKDFLTIYQTPFSSRSFLSAPASFSHIDVDTVYGRRNQAFAQYGNYVSLNDIETELPSVILPFHSLYSTNLKNVTVENQHLVIKENVPLHGQTQVVIPALATGQNYTTPAEISYSNAQITITFPIPKLIINDHSFTLAQLPAVSIKAPVAAENIVLQIADQQIPLKLQQLVLVSLVLPAGKEIPASVFDEADIDFSTSEPVISQENVIEDALYPNIWTELLNPQIFPVSPEMSSVNVAISLPVTAQTIPSTQSSDTNCDAFKRGEFTNLTEGAKTFFTADNFAILCHISNIYPVSTRNSYLVHIKGENLLGRSLRLFVYNKETNRSDLEEILPKKIFDSFYSLLSWSFIPENFYDLNLETRSFGQKSQNVTEKVEIYPFPLEYVSQIYLSAADPQSSLNLTNSTKLSQTWKWETYQYGGHVNTASNSGLLTLGQGYNSGWIAFSLPRFQIVPHVKYNGWANAWILPEGNYSLMIFYLPQLFNTFGYLFFAVTLAFLVRALRKNVS